MDGLKPIFLKNVKPLYNKQQIKLKENNTMHARERLGLYDVKDLSILGRLCGLQETYGLPVLFPSLLV